MIGFSLLLLYGIATQTSMAAMEVLGSLLMLGGLYVLVVDFRNDRLRWDWVDRSALFFIAALFLSLIFSPAQSLEWSRAFGLIRGLIGFLGLRRLVGRVDESQKSHLFWTPLWVAASAGALALFQFVAKYDPLRNKGLLEVMDPVTGAVNQIFRATGFFSSSMTFGHGILMPFILALTLALLTENRSYRYRAAFIAFLSAVGVYASYQRGPWLGMVAALLISGLFLPRKRQLTMAAAAVSTLVAVVILAPELTARLGTVFSAQYNSNAIRIDIWRGHLSLFFDHPFFGVGFSQTNTFLGEAYQRLGITNGFISHGHNNLIDFLSGSGILGAAAYLLFLVACSVRILGQETNQAQKIAFLALIWGCFCAGLTECSFKDGELIHQYFYWMALALPLA